MNHRKLHKRHENGVSEYKFVEQKRDAAMQEVLDRYNNLFAKAKQADSVRKHLTPEQRKEYRGTLTDSEKKEMKRLQSYIATYQANTRRRYQSVVSFSKRDEMIGHGQDSHVFISDEHTTDVVKYSVPSYRVNDRTVEYLKKKYSILQKYLAPFIPTSRFVLGERRVSIDTTNLSAQELTRKTAVTLQKRIQGMTFQEMTVEQRMRPEVLNSLRKAHRLYIALKEFLREEALKLGLSEDTLDVKLDIGHLSKYELAGDIDEDLVMKFASPNIMYDERKQQIFFIDFDLNDWNQQKEKVYLEVMKESAKKRFEALLPSVRNKE